MELAYALDNYIRVQDELIDALHARVRELEGELRRAFADDHVAADAFQGVPASTIREGGSLTVASRGRGREQSATLSGARRSRSR